MITFDFETRSAAKLNRVGAYKYAEHPSTQVLCMAWQFDDGPELGHWHRHLTGQGEWDPVEQSEPPVELMERVADGEIFEAHNSFFEFCVWLLCLMREFPEFPPLRQEQMRCSAAKAASFSLPRKLETVAEVLGLAERKDMEGENLMKKLARPARPVKHNPHREWYEDPLEHRRLWSYNLQDVRTEHGVSGGLRDLTPDELRVWQMDQAVNWRGVHCDRRMLEAATAMASEEVVRLNASLLDLTEGQVPSGTSRQKLRAWVNARGVELPDTKGATVDALLEEGVDDGQVAEALSICRAVNRTSTAKYGKMTEYASEVDDMIRGTLLYCGADRTGRWAGRGPQFHNFPRGSIKDMDTACEAVLTGDIDWVSAMYGDVMGHLSHTTRGALMASSGRDFLVSDFAAIEARDVFWLADDKDGLDAFRASDAGEGPEIYCVMADSIFGHPVNKVDNVMERFTGKQAILGCGFGMGHEKFHDHCLTVGGVDLPWDLCERTIRTYRDVHDPVVRTWYEQERAAKAAVAEPGRVFTAGKVSWAMRGHFLHCKLPSGRLLSYYKPVNQRSINFRFKVLKEGRSSTISMNMKASFGEGEAIRRAWYRAGLMCQEHGWLMADEQPAMRETVVLTFMGTDGKTKKWWRQETYGGRLVENIVQGMARDQMAAAAVRAEDHPTYDVVLSVHDELIAEADEGEGDLAEFEALMALPPDWCPDCPIVAEGWRGKRYRK